MNSREDLHYNLREWPTGSESVDKELHEVIDLLDFAWTIIANAGGGDWERETLEWQDAAKRWRERYHASRETDVKGK